MADSPISNLPLATSVGNSDLLPLVQTSTTKRVMMKSFLVQPMADKYSKFSHSDVADYVAGSLDATAMIQDMLDRAGANNGGDVQLPAGSFKLAGGLNVPRHVGLRGVSNMNMQQNGESGHVGGTWFLPSSTSVSAITISEQTRVERLNVWYPNQVGEGTPTPYPACIKVKASTTANGVDKFFLNDLLLCNPYIGIDASVTHEYMTVNNVHGFPLYRGMIIGQMYDIDRIHNVHFNPNNNRPWINQINGSDCLNTLTKWVNRNATAFEVRRTDWIEFSNCFTFGYHRGFVFTGGLTGYADVLCCGFDCTDTGVEVQGGFGGTWGVNIDGGRFTNPDRYSEGHAEPAIIIGSEQTTNVTNCRFHALSAEAVKINSGSDHSVNNCSVTYSNTGPGTGSAFIVIGGSTNGASVSNNRINGAGASGSPNGVLVLSGAVDPMVTNNRIHGVAGAGINIQSGVTGIVCQGNRINGTALVNNASSTGNLVTDNL